jgi:CMP-N-acetylneuraminic acid synthetase
MKNERVLGLILARSGSKRLPNKNIKHLDGKPLITWSIEAAKKSLCIDDVVVSTDGEIIAQEARNAGALTPFKRPQTLASDTASSTEAAIHALETLATHGKHYQWVVLLQPTSPLRTHRHIDEAFNMLTHKRATAVVSVCETEHSPLWCNTLNSDLSMDNFISAEVTSARSQDLSTYYRLNGAIYIISTEQLLKQRSFFPATHNYAYIMSNESSVDIDTELDFIFAQAILHAKKGQTNHE